MTAKRYSYPIAVLLGAVCSLLLFLGTLQALERTGNLPPPALTNSLCADEKLAFLRDHPTATPSILVVGSSVAWRHFDGEAVLRRSPGAWPLNGGFCGLAMHQTAFVTDYLLARFTSVREVVAIVAPQDFEDCSKVPARLFDPADVDAFLGHHRWPAGFYLRYFDPVSLARNAARVAAQRSGQDSRDPLVFTRFGDAPLDTDKTADLGYGGITGFDPACFAALQDLAGKLATARQRLVVAITPINPGWSARFDPKEHLLADFEARLRQAIAGAGNAATLWNGPGGAGFGTAAFTDAIHLRWSAARCFTEALVRATGLGGRPEPGLVALDAAAAPPACAPTTMAAHS
jgi:hypothetical protein